MLYLRNIIKGGVGTYKLHLFDAIVGRIQITNDFKVASIVHIHTPDEALKFFCKVLFCLQKRVIYTPHSYPTFFYKKIDFVSALKFSIIELFLFFFHFIFFLRCKKVICLTQHEFRTWTKYFPLFKGKFVIVPTAIKPLKKSLHSIPRTLVLWVGSFDDRKQPHRFLSFCRKFNLKFPENDLKFLMCWSGPLFDNILNLANSDEKLYNLEIHKNVDHIQIMEFMTKARFLVSFSSQEGLPMTFLEALESGVPIITSVYRGGDVYEFLNDSNSIIFKSEDDIFEQLCSKKNILFEDTSHLKQPYSFQFFSDFHINIYEGT